MTTTAVSALVGLAILGVVAVAVCRRRRAPPGAPSHEESEAPDEPYVRDEAEAVAAFYEPCATFMDEAPAETVAFIATLEKGTGLPRQAETYPVDASAVDGAARAFAQASAQVFGFALSLESDDATQMDRLINAHLVDPIIRRFYDGISVRDAMSEAEQSEYFTAVAALRIPREPLLYYCMGAFWGEWLCRHRHATWALEPPLRPVQAFPDMISVGSTVCAHPFSQVLKKMADPEGDQLAFKASPGMTWRYFPPFPLLASLSDAEHAVDSRLSPEARRAQRLAAGGKLPDALACFGKALEQSPDAVRVHAMAVQTAFQAQDWERAERWSLSALQLCPGHPVLNHNLAVLCSRQADRLPEAIRLLEAAIASAPGYGRAHVTLAGCYLEAGDAGKAAEHARWVKENDAQLAPEVDGLLAEIENRDAK